MARNVTLKSRIPQIAASLDPRVSEGLAVAAGHVAERAKQRVPVQTGRLRDAIHVERQDDGWFVVAGDTDAWYGHLVENGTVKNGATPFLMPSLEEERDEISAVVSVVLRRL